MFGGWRRDPVALQAGPEEIRGLILPSPIAPAPICRGGEACPATTGSRDVCDGPGPPAPARSLPALVFERGPGEAARPCRLAGGTSPSGPPFTRWCSTIWQELLDEARLCSHSGTG